MGSNVLRLQEALRAAMGEGFVELRGVFLYPHHGIAPFTSHVHMHHNAGFREFHANMYDPSGWRMYLVHKTPDSSANKSWFAIRDPHNGQARAEVYRAILINLVRQVYQIPDLDGQINLFHISQNQPVTFCKLANVQSESHVLVLGMAFHRVQGCSALVMWCEAP